MDFFKNLRGAASKFWNKDKFLKFTVNFLGNLLGVILPFILSYVVWVFYKKQNEFEKFVAEGNFLLFGAGLFTSSIILFWNNRQLVKLLIDDILYALSFLGLFFSALIYALKFADGFMNTSNKNPIDIELVKLVSLWLFGLSILTMLRSILIDSTVVPDANKEDHDATEKMKAELKILN